VLLARKNLILAKSKSHSSAAFWQELGILVDVPAYGRNLVGELCDLTLVLDVVTPRSVDWANATTVMAGMTVPA